MIELEEGQFRWAKTKKYNFWKIYYVNYEEDCFGNQVCCLFDDHGYCYNPDDGDILKLGPVFKH